MKKILMVALLAGLSGAAHAGVAAEQLGINKENMAMDTPMASAAAAVPGGKFNAPASKLTALKAMFETGAKMSYQQLNEMLNKDTGGVIAGSFVSNVLGSPEETEGISIASTPLNDGGDGPLWPAKPTGYHFRITTGLVKPCNFLIYSGAVAAQPSDEVKTISVKGFPMLASEPADMGDLNIEVRRNGSFVVGRLSGNAMLENNSQWVSYSGDAYFYIWQR